MEEKDGEGEDKWGEDTVDCRSADFPVRSNSETTTASDRIRPALEIRPLLRTGKSALRPVMGDHGLRRNGRPTTEHLVQRSVRIYFLEKVVRVGYQLFVAFVCRPGDVLLAKYQRQCRHAFRLVNSGQIPDQRGVTHEQRDLFFLERPGRFVRRGKNLALRFREVPLNEEFAGGRFQHADWPRGLSGD